MDSLIEVRLEQRRTACVVRLLSQDAPRTCGLVRPNLPCSGPAFHAKHGNNEVYTFVDLPSGSELGTENPTVTPIPGDVCLRYYAAGSLPRKVREERGFGDRGGMVDIAIFYGRNNLLVNGASGFTPFNVFGTVVDGLDEMAEACADVWYGGARGESLSFSVVD